MCIEESKKIFNVLKEDIKKIIEKIYFDKRYKSTCYNFNNQIIGLNYALDNIEKREKEYKEFKLLENLENPIKE